MLVAGNVSISGMLEKTEISCLDKVMYCNY